MQKKRRCELWLASANAHKIEEMQALLGSAWLVRPASEAAGFESPEETGSTFFENSEIKAHALSNLVDGLVLADDSGLEVESLGGAPGVYSARFAGADASDADNREFLLKKMADFANPEQRQARFRCCLVLAQNGRTLEQAEGEVAGQIIDTERGEQGFGYDSLFCPDGYQQTFAELGEAVKSRLSHRANAVEQILPALVKYLS